MDAIRRANDRRAVVTGCGAVSAAGWGVAALESALRSGRTAIGSFDRFNHAAQRTHLAGQVPEQGTRKAVRHCPQWNRLANSDRFAVFSAAEAVDRAGLPRRFDGYAAGVYFGSSTGGMLEAERYLEELVRHPGSRPSRQLMASGLVGAPAEAVARHLGIEGPVETVSSACASGGLAVELALRAIRDSEVDVAFAGGADCLCLTTYSGFNSLRAVDERPCRPFRADRSGLSLGEGGAVLVLEELNHARARGAHILAEVLGAGSTCDANHMTAPQAEGRWAALAVERALADAGLGPEAIDVVNAHGTGTPLNDAAESCGLARVFGERVRALPIEATKGVVGHLLGAAGAVSAVAAILGLLDCQAHPAPGSGDVDPALHVDLVLDRPRSVPGMRASVSASFGFGGANAAVVWGRWDGQ
jgi:3-oxoacyl-[acyl-carrier-protein] synthase II